MAKSERILISKPNTFPALRHEDLYDLENEPTIPSMRVPKFDQEHGSRITGLQMMAFAGIASSALLAMGGFFDSPVFIGVGGLVMFMGNMQALVRQ